MSDNHKNLVFDLDDGRQALVTVWEEGAATIATRDNPWSSWGPPTPATRIELVTGEGWNVITTTN